MTHLNIINRRIEGYATYYIYCTQYSMAIQKYACLVIVSFIFVLQMNFYYMKGILFRLDVYVSIVNCHICHLQSI